MNVARLQSTRLLPALALAAAFAAPAAFAATPAPITGVTVTSTSVICCGQSIANLVNGSGLSAYLPTATHAVATTGNSLFIQPITTQLTFDLGGTWLVSELAVWNYNSGPATIATKGVTMSWSFDGINFAVIPDAPTQFAQASQGVAVSAERFSFSRAASYIRFDILSNWGGLSASALDEVMFIGVPTAVPEPASAALMLAGAAALAGTALARRRAADRG